MAASHTPSPGRKSDKIWRDALMIAVKRTAVETLHIADDPKAPMIAKIAAQTVVAAGGGDMQAIKEIGDRLDGKPKQQTEITGGEDADGNAIPASINVNFRKGD